MRVSEGKINILHYYVFKCNHLPVNEVNDAVDVKMQRSMETGKIEVAI
jgi:hypothetical protein